MCVSLSIVTGVQSRIVDAKGKEKLKMENSTRNKCLLHGITLGTIKRYYLHATRRDTIFTLSKL